MNICEHLTATARLFPDRDAIRFEGAAVTYAELDARSRAAGQQLQREGIQAGDRVALMLANVPAFAVWYYAAARIGAIAVSLSTRSAASEIAFLTNDCGAKAFVADAATLNRVSAEMPACVQCTIATADAGTDCNDGPLIPSEPTDADWYHAEPHDAAAILYTSGTTGFAKGATLSHMNVRSNVHAFNHLCDMQPDDRILLAVPLFHCFGQNALLNSALNVGATLILQRRFDLNESKRLIAEERITQLYGVPMMFQLLLDSCEPEDLASVRYCFSAAATLPIQVSQQWQQRFNMPINEGYGLTETSPFASYNHRLKFVAGSIGAPIDAVEMKIVDPETGQDCPTDALGELVVRGPNVMLGYWNRREDTASAIRDGWFYSGDIGRRDARGYFYIVDRVKDMIAVGGLKVFPAEVERVLLDHPAVSQTAVVGMHDDVFGEQVVAFVVLSESSPADDAVPSIQQHAKTHLANYKTPRLVVPIDELPRNASGKVLKRELRNYDQSGHTVSDEDSDQTTAPAIRPLREATLRPRLQQTHAANRNRVATAFVQQLVQSIAAVERLPDPDERFLDVGLDSLMIVEISHQMQVELGPDHEIPATLLFDYPRIGDLAEFLTSSLFPNAVTQPTQHTQPTRDRPPSDDLDVSAMTEEEALQALMKELGDD